MAEAKESAEKITWKRPDGTDVPGYAFGDKSKPGVIVLQEWWGVDDQILVHAKNIADKGYRTLVPDLYRGKLGLEAEEARHLMSDLDFKGAVEDIRGAARFLKENGSKKVAVIGFCMGGALSFAAAYNVEELSCAVPCYGTAPNELCDYSKLKLPIQAHFGENDNHKGFSDPETVDKVEAQMKESSSDFVIHRYPSVGHAFLNDTESAIKRKKDLGMGEHDAEAVKLAWERIFSFFEKHLA